VRKAQHKHFDRLSFNTDFHFSSTTSIIRLDGLASGVFFCSSLQLSTHVGFCDRTAAFGNDRSHTSLLFGNKTEDRLGHYVPNGELAI